MSSNDRVIRVSRGKNEPLTVARVTGESADPSNQPQVFNAMQRNMEDELEKRRHDWEKEVEKMQQDFFQLKSTDKSDRSISSTEYSSSPGGNREVAVSSHQPSLNPIQPLGPSGHDMFDISNRKDLYTDMPDGSRLFRMRFDVRGFDPEEISVRAEGDKLTVSAKKEEEHDGKHKNTRQYNRKADIPEDVDPDTVTSSLSADGVLTVEAPAIEGVLSRGSAGAADEYDDHLAISGGFHSGGSNGGFHSQMVDFDRPHQFRDSPNEYHRVVESSYSGGRDPHFNCNVRSHPGKANHVHLHREPIKHKFPASTGSYEKHKIITPSKYRSTVNNNIGKTDTFQPIGKIDSFQTSGNKTSFRGSEPNVISTKNGPMLKVEVQIGDYQPEDVKIELIGDRKISVQAKKEENIGGRTSRREFSREFDIPEPIHRRYLKAKLSRDGRLVFGGSFMSNSNHDQVLQSLYNDMPIYGANINVE